MPLLKSKSKKAFDENVKSEMDAGKPQKQSLAIAYSVKRQAGKKKKMASGGKVDISAHDESRPMPDDLHADKASAMRQEDRPRGDVPIDFASEKRASIDGPVTSEEMDMIREYRRGKMMAEGGEISALDEHMSGIDDAASMRDEHMLMGKRPSMMAERRAGGKYPDADSARTDRDEDMLEQSLPEDEYSKKGRINYADGGEVDLSRNADEDPNYEDDLSFNALRKENYSESAGLDELDSPMDSGQHGDEREIDSEDEHDGRLVSKIRSKMKSKRA